MAVLRQSGSVLAGCADLSQVPGAGYPRGVAVAVPVPAQIIRDIQDGPTDAYFDAYYRLNRQLDEIVLRGEAYLTGLGYRAYAQTTTRVSEDARSRTPLPHKTVAIRAGLGWVGRNCLLVTEDYGSAVRISSLLTDAPLDCAGPVLESRCRGCRKCVDACPAQALTGIPWTADTDRDALLRWEDCIEMQKTLSRKHTSHTTDFLCGKCIAVCPFTQRYTGRCLREWR